MACLKKHTFKTVSVMEIMKYSVFSISEDHLLTPVGSYHFFFCRLTVRFLETVTPLVVGQLSVFKGVAGVEQWPHAQLVFVEVNGAEL